ncbi:MAG: UDP-N-acetylmuramoyl-tripeptide--D-alanyl-D-alanine ligase [Kiritimatiellia bacterium]
MPKFSARELAEWSGGAWLSGPPERITGAGNDSRTIERGAVYFALRGEHFDGHAFVEEAFRRGASSAVISRENARGDGNVGTRDRPLLAVDDPHRALCRIARCYRRKVKPEIVLGITGSVGKTTVKDMTTSVFAASMPAACTFSNWNNDIGLPLSLLRMEGGTRAGIFELGSNHPGEISRLCGILEPSWALVTGIGPVHTEFFKSVEEIAGEKAQLLKALPRGGKAILSPETECFDILCSAAPEETVTVAVEGEADYVCSSFSAPDGRCEIEERSTGEKSELIAGAPGRHNILNAMFAAAAGRAAGLDWETVERGLAGFSPSAMRWEEKTVEGISVVNDCYNANPLSMRAAIRTFSEMTASGAKWLVLGAMMELGERARREHVLLGEFAAAAAENQAGPNGLITVGALGKLIAEGAEKAGMSSESVIRCESTDQAAEAVKTHVRRGDALLLKGSRAARLEKILELLVNSEVVQ